MSSTAHHTSDPAGRRPDASGIHPHAAHGQGHHPHTRKELAWLSLGALGVVYGDIGTSPLYALKECFTHENPHRAAIESGVLVFDGGRPAIHRVIETANLLGVLSLFV